MNWKLQLNIRPILFKDMNTDESAAQIAKELSNYLKQSAPGFLNLGLDSVINRLNKSNTQCKVNKALSCLYDFCDNNGIWLGI